MINQIQLLKIMLAPNRKIKERAEAGRNINIYGDPRPGTVDFDFHEEYWCQVTEGNYRVAEQDGDNETRKVRLQTFYIAKYLVTYKQFRLFLEDGATGYQNPKWWAGLHAEGVQQQIAGAGEQRFKFDNHPCENVSWYDAIAFCRWLSAKLGYQVRLPNELEWEVAARGTDDRQYPYPGEYDAKKGNTRGTGINQTSAVGLFPDGASPYGVLDMSGNVNELMLNEYHTLTDSDLSNNARRVLRGGDWNNSSSLARIAFRSPCNPSWRDSIIGFRLVSHGYKQE